jgi:hypothetical protein
MNKTIGLIGLIFFDICLLVTLAIFNEWFWFFCFVTITTTVGVFEGLSYTVYGKTISQQYYKFRKEHPVGSLLGLIFFGLSMASLILHLF